MLDFKNMGNKAFALPFVICVVLVCVLGLAVAPILCASPKNVPFAIVSLDEGATTFAGQTNVGQTLVDSLTSGEPLLAAGEDVDGSAASMQGAISFTELGSEEEAREALGANEYYGAIVIPKGFTSAQMLSAVGVGEPPSMTVLLNQAKNPMLANTMQTTLASAMLQMGVVLEVEMINEADIGGGSMSGMMAVQMLVMPLMMMVMMPAIFLSVLTWPRDEQTSRRQKAKRAGVQACVIVALSLLAASLAIAVDVVGGGLTLPVGRLLPFLWLSCFCLLLAGVGLVNLAMPLGALCIVAVFALGMGTAMLPAEMLPEFWAHWICPWAPQAAIGEGVRSIIYMGNGPFETSITQLIGAGLIGAASMTAAVFAPPFNPAKLHEKMAAKTLRQNAPES